MLGRVGDESSWAEAGQADTDASPTAPGPAIQAPASSLAEHADEHEGEREPIPHGHAPEPHEDSGESVTPRTSTCASS